MRKILIAWIPAFIASLAVASSGFGTFYCDSIAFNPDPLQQDIQDTTAPYPPLYFGPWYQRDTVVSRVNVNGETTIHVKHVCVRISSNVDIDSKWKTVRAFGIITFVLSAFMLIPLYFAPCYGSVSESNYKFLAVLYMTVITMFQGLSFLWFMDGSACDPYTPLFGLSTNTDEQNEFLQRVYPNQCERASGTSAAITATVLFFTTGIVMLAMGAPKREAPPPPQTQEVVYERTLNPDGTYTTQEVNVVKGTAVA